MRQNYRGNKSRKEESRKRKQKEKKNKRLNKKTQVPLPDPSSSGIPDENPASFPTQDQQTEASGT